MELLKSQELIKKIKQAKEENEITYPRLMEMIQNNKKFVSKSTLMRVFKEGSENDTFSYETTLLPIAEVLLSSEDIPTPDSPYAKEIDNLKAIINSQNEVIERLKEMIDHLEERITFLLGQIETKDRRIDEKEETIQKLMNKYVLKE